MARVPQIRSADRDRRVDRLRRVHVGDADRRQLSRDLRPGPRALGLCGGADRLSANDLAHSAAGCLARHAAGRRVDHHRIGDRDRAAGDDL